MTDDSTESALYRVGITNDLHIELTVGYPTSISLTMDKVGTRNLILLLQAAINAVDDSEPAR